MGTILENYLRKKTELEEQAENRQLLPDENWLFQELSYRIFILESIAFLEKTAPITMDMVQIKAHYISLDALVSHMQSERRYAQSSDERIENIRFTALNAIGMIQHDYRHRFSGYLVENKMQYSADIKRVISTILPAWVQYRNTLLNIKRKETNDEE